jgi:hypothetical protein
LLEALELARADDDQDGAALFAGNAVMVFRALGDFERAEPMERDTLALKRAVGDPRELLNGHDKACVEPRVEPVDERLPLQVDDSLRVRHCLPRQRLLR